MLYSLLKIKFLLLLVFAISEPSYAQKVSKTDSLIKVLKTQKEDTSKVNTLNALSVELWQTSNYSEAKKYAEDALAVAEKTRFNTGKSYAYNNIGIVYSLQGNYPEALKNHTTALNISEGIGNKKAIGYAYNCIAVIYSHQGNYNEALKNFLNSLKINQQIGFKRGVSTILNNIGNIYSDQGNYPEALKQYLAALKINEEMGYKSGIAASYGNIGSIYSYQGNYPEALENYFAALKINEEIGSINAIAYSYNNIGFIYEVQNNYPEALKKYLASRKIFEKTGDKKGLAFSYNALGVVYKKLYDYPEALKNHFASLKIREEIGDKEGVANSDINIGETYIELENIFEATRFLQAGLAHSLKIRSKDNIKESYRRLAMLDSATGNWEGAYQNHKLFILYRDSLVNEESSKKIIQSQMQYEFDKKEDSLNYQQTLTNEKLKQQTLLVQQQEQSLLLKQKEFALLSNAQQIQQLQIEKNEADFAVQKVAQKAEDDKKQGQLVLLNKEKSIQSLELNKQKQLKKFLLAGFVLFAILSFFIYRNYRNRQNVKLLMLRNKIASDLHDDVGSTLSSISLFSQMAQQQSKEVIPMLETIGDSSRKMLEAMADIVWTINPENDQFEKIILRMRSFAYELLGVRKIDFEFIADEEVTKIKLPMNVRKNLYLIFKEATNNMVKYSGADKALFTIKEEKNRLIMLINDNGKGFDSQQSREGNGLKNMKRRADEIKAQFKIVSNPGKGTSVQLSIAV